MGAVTSATRAKVFPDTPSIVESGLAEVQYTGWLGLFAPKGLPAEVLVRIQRGLEDALKDDATRQTLTRQGIEANPASAAALRERVEADTRRWAQLIKTRKIEPQ